MTKIIDRYILKEFFFPFILWLSVFTFVLLTSQSLKLMDLIVVGNVSGFSILKMFLCIIPSFLLVTFPMTILLGSVMAFGRLSSDREIVAMMASGVTFTQMAKPILIASFAGYLITMFLSLIAVPKSNKIFKETVMGNLQKTILSSIHEGIFNDKMGDFILYVGSIDHKRNRLKGIFIADYRAASSVKSYARGPVTVFAKEGEIFLDSTDSSLSLLLLEGSIEQAEQKGKKRFEEVRFKRYKLKVDMEQFFSKQRKNFKESGEWSLKEMQKEINQAKQEGKDYFPIQTDLIKKFSLPVTCFIFGIISIPLGISTEKINKMRGFPICIIFFVLYYMLWNACEHMAKSGIVNPYIALWTPNTIMGIIAASMFFQTEKISKGQFNINFDFLKKLKFLI